MLKLLPIYEERFKKRYFNYVEKSKSTEGCWNWTGAGTKEGYGHISYKAKVKKSSRIMWEWIYGKIPNKMIICHNCDNPKCVNPDHLFLGTDAINRVDCMKKGRMKYFHGENCSQAKLKDFQVLEIKKLLKDGFSITELAKMYSMGKTTIAHIKNGDNWKHIKI